MKYTSQTSAAALLTRVKAACLLENKPEDALFYEWLNVLLSELYSGVIRDEHLWTANKEGENAYPLPSVGTGSIEAPRPADIIDVYAAGYPFTRVPPSYAQLTPAAGERTYYIDGTDRLVLCSSEPLPASVTVCCRARPAAIGSQNASAGLPLPDEFVSMADAKLLGEAYRWAGENTLAANWLAEYNARFDTFRLWLRLGGRR